MKFIILLILFSPLVYAADPAPTGTVVNFSGWESGDASETIFSGGTVSVQTSVVRSGVYALRVNPTTTNVGHHRFRGLGGNGTPSNLNLTNTYTRFYFRVAAYPNGICLSPPCDEPMFDAVGSGSVDKFELRLQDDGKLVAYDSALTKLATGASILALNTWYKISILIGTGTSASWEVRIDNNTEISGTANLTTGASIRLNYGKRLNRFSHSIDFFYDDLLIDSTNWPTDGRIQIMQPDGDGTSTAWTGDFTDVDEIPHDSDTTHIVTSTSGDVETVNLESALNAGITRTINAVKRYAIVRDTGGVSSFQVRLISGATTSNTTTVDPGGSYTLLTTVFNVDPNTSAAWTMDALDGIQVGVVANANVEHRATSIAAMVSYNPGIKVVMVD
jgi:hypothetical protein